MDDQQIYAYYPVFRATQALREMAPAARDAAIHEVELLVKEWSGSERIGMRGVYSTVGFRPDADLMMWWVSPSPDAAQSPD